MGYSNSSESNSGSSALQGKTHRSKNYLKDFFLAWIWVIQSPSLELAIPSFARLSAVIRSLFIQRYLSIKKKTPNLNGDHKADLLNFAVAFEVIISSFTCKVWAGTGLCCLLHHRNTHMASGWRKGSHRHNIYYIHLRFQSHSENESQAPQGSSN